MVMLAQGIRNVSSLQLFPLSTDVCLQKKSLGFDLQKDGILSTDFLRNPVELGSAIRAMEKDSQKLFCCRHHPVDGEFHSQNN